MEAEEERKFNNGETYDDNEDYGLGDNVKSYAGTTSLSPKEQASQEMQVSCLSIFNTLGLQTKE